MAHVLWNPSGNFRGNPIATLWNDDDGKMRLCVGANEDGVAVTYEDLAELHDGLGKILKAAGFSLCDCGCGKLAKGGHMEAAHPEDYRYDERA